MCMYKCLKLSEYEESFALLRHLDLTHDRFKKSVDLVDRSNAKPLRNLRYGLVVILTDR